MTPTDYLIDSALVLLVLLRIKERKLTTRSLVRPLVIVAIAVAIYMSGVPTAGNDHVLVGALVLLGLLIGLASGYTMLMRRGPDGDVLARAGGASAFFWVLGMGSRFAFIYWLTHTGAPTIARFGATTRSRASRPGRWGCWGWRCSRCAAARCCWRRAATGCRTRRPSRRPDPIGCGTHRRPYLLIV